MGLETSTITFLAKYLRSSKIQIVVLLTCLTLLTVFEPRNKKNLVCFLYYYIILPSTYFGQSKINEKFCSYQPFYLLLFSFPKKYIKII